MIEKILLVVGLAAVAVGVALAAYTLGLARSPVSRATPAPTVHNAPGYATDFGTVVSADSAALVLKLTDGTTKTYGVSASTTVTAAVRAGQQVPQITALPRGALVAVVYAKAQEGTPQATTINVAPSSLPH